MRVEVRGTQPTPSLSIFHRVSYRDAGTPLVSFPHSLSFTLTSKNIRDFSSAVCFYGEAVVEFFQYLPRPSALPVSAGVNE